MSEITGVVQDVQQYPTKIGPMYNIIIDGNRFGAGKENPGDLAGKTVKLVYTEKGQYKNVVGKAIVLSDNVAKVVTGAPVSAAVAKAAAGGEYVTDAAKQKTISRQAARNSAIAAVNVLVAAGAIPTPAKSAKLADVILAFIDKLTEEYYAYSMSGNIAPNPQVATANAAAAADTQFGGPAE